MTTPSPDEKSRVDPTIIKKPILNLHIGRNIIWLFIVVSTALLLPGIAEFFGLNLEGRKTLFILTLAIGLWVSEAIPPFATALLVVGFQIFFLGTGTEIASDLALEKYTKSWSSPVIWLLLGGFFLSLSMTLTGIDRMIFTRISSLFGRTSRWFLLGTMLIAATLSMFMSNTATTALLIGVLGPILAQPSDPSGLKKSLLIGIPAAASIGGMSTLIGSTPNAIAYSFLSEQGINFGFLDWFLVGGPLVFVLLPLSWISICYFSNLKTSTFEHIDLAGELDEHGIKRKLRKRDRHIVLWTFLVTIGLWASAPLHSVSVSVTSMIPIVALTVTGVIRSSDIRLIPWDTLLLIMGGMSLGQSVIESGLAQFIVSRIAVPENFPLLMLIVFGYSSVFLSTFMSNTAAAAILIPLGSALDPNHTLQIALVIALSSSIATSLPVSTPPNAIAYATGQIKSKEFATIGIILAVVGPIFISMAVSALGRI